MNKLFIFSLIIAVASAFPTRYENEGQLNELVSVAETNNEIIPYESDPMIDFEIDYELNLEEYKRIDSMIPDKLRNILVESLRKLAIKIKLKVLDLVQKMDDEVEKLQAAYKLAKNPLYKSKVWTQLHSLKLLKTVTMAGLEKFDQYIISENSKVLENLIRALEKLFESKFFGFTQIAKITYKLLRNIDVQQLE